MFAFVAYGVFVVLLPVHLYFTLLRLANFGETTPWVLIEYSICTTDRGFTNVTKT